MGRNIEKRRTSVQTAALVTALVGTLCAASQAGARTLSDELRSIVIGPGGRNTRVGVMVAELPTGKKLFAHRGNESFIPASNQKLFVAEAALATFGPDHRFATRLLRRGTIRDGVLWGDLYLVGQGDPGLNTGHLYEMGLALRRAGVQSIAGDLVTDDTFFFTPERQYLGGSTAKAYFAPTGALSLNQNTVHFTLEGTSHGQPAAVRLDPPGGFIRVTNRVLTRLSTNVSLSRHSVPEEDHFSLWGSVGEGETERLVRGITDPTAFCVQALVAVLADLGIEMRGHLRRAPAPTDAVLLHEQRSSSVAELLLDMNKASNNFLADQMALQVGAWRDGSPATWPKAARFLQARLASLGLSHTLVQDGSGLSANNRTSPSDLVLLLSHAYASPFWPQFAAGLPIGGRDGTLSGRLRDWQMLGRVRAKTGTISGVSTLSGYVFRDDGRVLAFSILVNGSGAVHSRHLQDDLVRAMVEQPLDEPVPVAQKVSR